MKEKKKIDGYAKAKRKKLTNLCIVYARERAIEWLGNTAYHVCDPSCSHDEACLTCKFSAISEHEIPRGVVGETCLRGV